RCSLLSLAILPAPWLLFSFVFARGDHPVISQRLAVSLGCACLIPSVVALVAWEELVLAPPIEKSFDGLSLRLGWAGKALQVWLLVGAVAVLTNLERTFRASIGTIRWRIKFMLMGLGVLFLVIIYSSSQFLLYGQVNLSLLWLRAVALPIVCLLMTRAQLREGVFNVAVYPSRIVLQNSVTALAAGVYLLVVGVLAKIVIWLGGDAAFPIKALFVLLALAGVTVLLLSDRVQQRTRLFVSRHFKRPLYDYQKVWHAFTERTASILTATDLCRAVARLFSETFQVLSVTIWLVDESKDKLTFAASTSLSEDNAQKLSGLGCNVPALKAALTAQQYPVDIDESIEEWVEVLKCCNPDQFRESGHRICVPLIAKGNLLGLITLGDRVSGAGFNIQDFDLLKCIGEQVAASLLNIQLSQSLLQAKELEAFQTMSAFFVHDLKNTASTLSLMLQNLPAHFEDPAFRADALRAVGKSVERINTLIGRVSLLRQTLAMNLREADLNEVVNEALSGLEAVGQMPLTKNLSPVPKLRIDAEQIQKVVTNLVLNAWDAVESNALAEVRLETTRQNGWVVLCVWDNGCGMSSDFLRHSLFRPFQTTKKKGIGVGMFHCRAIIEAHRGKIEVISEVGRGTTFRVMLPCEEKKA
ncbi:MAG: PEP-CTERM system histidine kinase PrsK, partial [Acidobacteria bacterium]|nr:PEP-CTERM system histidine kinase PrsK [Acidobacteriota bacterium]